MRALAVVVTGASLAACGLSVVGQAQSDDEAGPAPTVEAASPDVATESSVEAAMDARQSDALVEVDAQPDARADADADAGADADADTGTPPCTVLIDDHFTPPLAPSWKLVGDSPALEGPAKLVMTHGSTEGAALWWTAQLQYTGTLRVTMSYTSSGASTGEGMTIAWQKAADFRRGGASNGSGLCGANMFGVGVSARFADQIDVLKSFDGNCGFTDGINGTNIPATGVFGLTGTPAFLRASVVGGGTNLSTQSNVSTPKSGYLGFTASTAGGSTRHTTITAVHAESCP